MGPTDAAVVSGAPLDLQSRTVRIYKPTKTATQSGNWSSRQWRLDWDVLPRGHRWENPLMGWQSSGDFMQGSHIFFKTKEDAIHFAEKQGAWSREKNMHAYEWQLLTAGQATIGSCRSRRSRSSASSRMRPTSCTRPRSSRLCAPSRSRRRGRRGGGAEGWRRGRSYGRVRASIAGSCAVISL